jgi:hypothetical protein
MCISPASAELTYGAFAHDRRLAIKTLNGAASKIGIRPSKPQAKASSTPIEVVPVPPPEHSTPVRLPDGRYNWSQTYIEEGFVYRLEATGDEHWAARIVDWGLQVLAERDAPSPIDYRPYAWFDRSNAVLSPYVWIGFTGHMFAPLMEFASYVIDHSSFASRTHRGHTYRDYALSFMREFTRALDVDTAEMANDGPYTFFRFVKHVPVKNRLISNQPLPVNMNSAAFTAILYLAKAESILGQKANSERFSKFVAGYVAYLNDRILMRRACGAQICLIWRYSNYIGHVEDVSHANLTVKFMEAAYEHHYKIRLQDLVDLANTFNWLMDADGNFTGNLLDGSTIASQGSAIYYIILLAHKAPGFKEKIERAIAKNRNFAYYAAWLKTEDR